MFCCACAPVLVILFVGNNTGGLFHNKAGQRGTGKAQAEGGVRGTLRTQAGVLDWSLTFLRVFIRGEVHLMEKDPSSHLGYNSAAQSR